jgi:hypothetical protein
MPTQGTQDRFELEYMARLKGLLTTGGVPIAYEQDRAAIDTGLHLFVEGPGDDWSASQVRVWFQVKGKRAATLSLERFRALSTVEVQVSVDHLQFWYAAPEPVYLAVFIEAADVFLAEDVRALVNRTWPDHDFYRATRGQRTATVRVATSAVLDRSQIHAMLRHRSMRIDGATFQGRPLGHRLDPLRCELAFDDGGLWKRTVERILREHRYRHSREAVEIGADLVLLSGRFYDTMLWQSSAFAEFGYGPDDDFRDDPAVEWVQGPAAVLIDRAPGRTDLGPDEREALRDAFERTGGSVVLFFNGKDLSGTGGTWRSFFREALPGGGDRRAVSMLGHEALTCLVLTATLVYLDLAPELSFKTLQYRSHFRGESGPMPAVPRH